MQFTLPKEARTAILASGRWSGEVRLDLVPSKKDPNLIRMSLMEEESVQLQCLQSDEAKLVKAWNDDPYIRGQAKVESRNDPIRDDEVMAHLRIVRKALDVIGLDKLLTTMASYMAACSDGRHVWKGAHDVRSSNHGYKTLTGFLQKLLELKRKGKGKPWWMKGEKVVVDEHPELTLLVADVFARKLLSREKFGLKPEDRAYQQFKAAADIVAVVAERNPWGLDAARVAGEAIECLGGYIDGVISPGHMAGEHLWKVALPQFLRTRYE